MNFYQKYIVATLPIVLIGTGALGYWAYSQSRDALYNSEREVMVHLLSDSIDHVMDRRYKLLQRTGLSQVDSFINKYKEEVFSELRTLGAQSGRRFIVFDDTSVPVFCSDCPTTEVPAAWMQLSAEIGELRSGTLQSPEDGQALYAAVRYARPNWNWVVFITRSDTEVLKQVTGIRLVSLIVSLASILAVAAMLALVTHRLLLKPILKLRQAATQIASHEPVDTIDINSDDELGQLARGMEHMSRSIR